MRKYKQFKKSLTKKNIYKHFRETLSLLGDSCRFLLNRTALISLNIIQLVIVTSCAAVSEESNIYIHSPSFSPDNKMVTYTYCRGNEGCRLAFYDLLKKEVRFLRKENGYHMSYGVFSRDGKKIAFKSQKIGQDVGVIKILDTIDMSIKNISKVPTIFGHLSYSPNDKKLLFLKAEKNNNHDRKIFTNIDVYEINIDNGGESKFTDMKLYGASKPYYLPDGKSIIFSADLIKNNREYQKKYGRNEIFVLKRKEKISSPAFVYKHRSDSPSISYDGRIIAFLSDDKESSKTIITIKSNNVFQEIYATELYIGDLTISPDGKKIVFTTGNKMDLFNQLWIGTVDGINFYKVKI